MDLGMAKGDKEQDLACLFSHIRCLWSYGRDPTLQQVPLQWVPGWIPAAITSDTSTALKQGSVGAPTTTQYTCSTGVPLSQRKMHGCSIATCSRVDMYCCNGSQPVLFTLRTLPPPSPPSPTGVCTASAASLPTVPSPVSLRPWLPSVPGEQ